MKKFLGLIVAAALILGFAGQSMAAFANLELVRVVYRTDGSIEVGTDLGNVTTLLGSGGSVGGGSNAFNLSQFGAGTSWDNLRVAYVAKNSAPGYEAWFSGTATQTSGLNKWNTFNGNWNNVLGYYGTFGTTTVVADKGNLNSYWSKMDKSGNSIGQFGGYIMSPVGSEVSLASLASGGYVEQSLYYFGGSYAEAQSAGPGTLVGTIRTYADGHTEISAAPVPIPGALWLLGPAFIGLIGLRRRSA